MRENLPLSNIFSVLTGTAGAALIVSSGTQLAFVQTQLPLMTWLTGVLLMMLSPLLFAAGTVSLKTLGDISLSVVPTYVNVALTIISALVLWS